jgi:hypothetical protein
MKEGWLELCFCEMSVSVYPGASYHSSKRLHLLAWGSGHVNGWWFRTGLHNLCGEVHIAPNATAVGHRGYILGSGGGVIFCLILILQGWVFRCLRMANAKGDLFKKMKNAILLRYVYLTAIGLTPGGSSTAHIYIQTVHRIHRTYITITKLSLHNNKKLV